MNGNIKINIDFSGLWEVAIFATIIFLILKIANLIAWSWWWVFSPLLIVGGIVILVYLVVIIALALLTKN